MIKLSDDRRKVPGVCLGGIWIGDAADEIPAVLDRGSTVSGLLCVARDMQPRAGWDSEVEAAHVGLLDGPGNELSAYCAAVLALHSLLRRHNTLVFCHTGTRSLVVAMMYLNVATRRGWDGWLEVLRERGGLPLVMPHEAHREAFLKVNWKFLQELMR